MSILDILYFVLIMPIQLVFETFFMVAYRLVGSPGVAIVVLSLAMNFLVLPLYMRADKMQEHERDMEAKLHAGVAHIRKVFSGDEKMMMLQAYYRENGYRPTDVFKGSVSLFLEIPFFIAAYQYLSHLGLLDGVSFWFIRDLGAPDGLLSIDGATINVLPFVMTAINLATCLLFTKGMPAKTKVQLYVMAALFLVLLYNSPAGLVFYWTLNNVFSLVKTLFYKLKNPKQVLAAVLAVAGVAILVAGHLLLGDISLAKKALVIVLGLALLMPLVVLVVRRMRRRGSKGREATTRPAAQPSAFERIPATKKTYVAAALFLMALFGLLIPSAVIAASPQEFCSLADFVDPIWYVVSSLCLAIGTFGLWMGVFYWLTTQRYRPLFQLVIWVACGIALVDYLLFGTNLGLLTPSLQYQGGLSFDLAELLVNVVVLAVIAAIFIAFFLKFSRQVSVVLGVSFVALAGMSVYNMVQIQGSIAEMQQQVHAYQDSQPSLTLSKDKPNVVVLMLDRALGEYVPFIMNEKPELKQQFAGFTYYDNVTSFGGFTNFGAPALYGGYEYTSAEMNRRSDELLVDKHDEALKVMPVLFAENDFDVTVCDPTYAGYQWVPDISIFDGYEGIKSYITIGWFTDPAVYEQQILDYKRNFFYFGLMKALPLFAQTVLYDNGHYNNYSTDASRADYGAQVISDDGLRAEGQHKGFLDSFNVLRSLNSMTRIVEDDGARGNFVMMSNDSTHEPQLLQEPQYEPAEQVDNTAYEAEHHDRFTLPEGSMNMENGNQYRHYQSNMAAFMKIGKWLDYLRANGVYDNTRIIIVSDHGTPLMHNPDLHEFYYPLLMVKDFGATEFTTNSEFMTNADVPTLATEGLIANPVNPFTGNAITNDEKTAHDQHVFVSNDWDVSENGGTTYLPGEWLSVRDDVRDPSNWESVDDPNA